MLVMQLETLKNDIAKKEDVLEELNAYDIFFRKLGKNDWTAEELTQFMSKLEQDNLELLLKLNKAQSRSLHRALVQEAPPTPFLSEEEVLLKKHPVEFKQQTQENIADVIKNTYNALFHSHSSPSVPQMLTDIETKINHLMEQYDRLSPSMQRSVKKTLDKKMRDQEQLRLVAAQEQKVQIKMNRTHQKKKVKVHLKKKDTGQRKEEADPEDEFFWK